MIESREIDGKVYVDLKEMTNEEVCTPFTIIQTEKNSTYSGSINVYDFYNHALITNAVRSSLINSLKNRSVSCNLNVHEIHFFRCSMLLLVVPIQRLLKNQKVLFAFLKLIC